MLASDLMEDIQQQRGREILGASPVIKTLRSEIELVAKSDFTVLILGETGVGKELVARSVHNRSQRRGKPLLYLNCAALPESLAESELFGHVKGAFTGAVSDRTGKFALAQMAVPFSLMKSESCRWMSRQNCCEPFRKGRFSESVRRKSNMSMYD